MHSNIAFLSQATLMLKMHVFLWMFSEVILHKIGLPVDKYEINQTYLFTVLSSIIEVVLSTPFKLYSTFVIEEKHGFNNQVSDKIIKISCLLIVSLLSNLPILLCPFFFSDTRIFH